MPALISSPQNHRNYYSPKMDENGDEFWRRNPWSTNRNSSKSKSNSSCKESNPHL